MEMGSQSGKASGRRGGGQILSYVLVAAAVWFAWEVVKTPLIQRFPPALAIRLAPTSPEVLRRAAESEFAQRRMDNAEALAAASLEAAPFNARALRVIGLVAAEKGQNAAADQMLTLSGNWSLRDDASHAWLVEHRLRQGDYRSSFAHADTLARRRPELHPQVFNLFTTAALANPHALTVVRDLLTARPPWRSRYWHYLSKHPEGPRVAFALAVGLEGTDAPLDDNELERLYTKWASQRLYTAIRELRGQLRRPSTTLLENGDFSTPLADQILPFGWTLGARPGLLAEVAQDDLDPENLSLWTNYSGSSATQAAHQTLLLRPGAYVLSGRQRLLSLTGAPHLSWLLICIPGAQTVAEHEITGTVSTAPAWQRFEVAFSIPSTNCDAQRLQLSARPAARESTFNVWFDDIEVEPAA